MVNLSELKLGDKLSALTDLYEPASGDNPCLLYARFGDVLIVRYLESKFNRIGVSHEDVLDKYFFVETDEVGPA